MAIELVGDREAISALGIQVSSQSYRPRGGSVETVAASSRFATFSVPDIRVPGYPDSSESRLSALRPNVGSEGQLPNTAEANPNKRQVADSNKPRQKTLTSLQSIKQNIERQSASNSTDRIFEDIARIDSRIAKKEYEPDQPVVEAERMIDAVKLQPKSAEECYLSTLNPKDQQVMPIADSIIEKFPVGANAVVAFAGTERNEQLETVVASVAVALRQAKECRVLIVDSDIKGGFLTDLMKETNSVGLTDLSKSEMAWEQVLQPTSDGSIHFLPTGESELAFPEKMANLLKKITPNFVGQYDYVLVNVGDAHGAIAELWSSYTNGTFLLVSMSETNQNVAKSAVAQLNSFGARLIGCVVSDTDVLS